MASGAYSADWRTARSPSMPACAPRNCSAKAPAAACAASVNSTSGFSRELRRCQVPVLRLALLLVDRRAIAALLVLVVLHRHRVGALHLVGQLLDLLEADVGIGDLGRRESRGSRLAPARGLRGSFSITPKSSALPTQADTQAGFSPTSRRSTHMLHLRDLALDRVELRRVVRAHPGAVAAAEAGFRVLQHRAVFGVLGVGARRAALQAHRVVAMVARHRDVHALVVGEAAAFDIAHRAEGQVRRVVVLLAARRFAGMAADAVVGGEVRSRAACCGSGCVPTAGFSLMYIERPTGELALRSVDQIDLLAVAVGLGHVLSGCSKA